jgi:hypothetical protein
MKLHKDITRQVWAYILTDKTKIAKRVLNKLDYDIANFVQVDDSIIIEPVSSFVSVPDYVYDYIKKHEKNIISFSDYLQEV